MSNKRARSTDSDERVKRQKTASESQQNTATSKPPVAGPRSLTNSTSDPLVARSKSPKSGISSNGKGKAKSVPPLNADKGKKRVAPINEARSNQKPRRNINKLVPPRPFPTVHKSVSATGPRSAHREGKNQICLTRKTPLGHYLRRCKDVFVKDGYKSLHLSAMGAAIPHLAQLTVSLPTILPFPQDEIHTSVTTSTVEVQDEVLPSDEEEDVTYETRGKSTMAVIIRIGDGDDGGQEGRISAVSAAHGHGDVGKGRGSRRGRVLDGKGKGKGREVVVQEPEQEDMETQ